MYLASLKIQLVHLLKL